MFKLALNAGHGLKTSGKRCLKAIDPNETREWSLNSRICDKLENLLKQYDGIEVKRIDDVTGAVDYTVSKRAKAANEWNADLYLSIHHNAGIGGGSGGGIEVYTYTKVGDATRQWQDIIYNYLIEQTGLRGNRSQGTKTANFGECRLTNMPAILAENGFMDSTVDTPIILTEDFAQKAALAYCRAITDKLGLTEKSQSKLDNNTIARQVIEGIWGNGAQRKNSLENAGYDYYAIQRIVNGLVAATPKKKTNQQIADEVIKGLWGNGEERKQRLKTAGYDYSQIQKIVNSRLK